jgi:hypothetical protein
MSIDIDLAPETPRVSATRTVTVALPENDAVPLKAPLLELSAMPGGSPLPLQANGPVPPIAVSDAE